MKTPYFPSTTNIDKKFGFSLSLRYVDLIREYLEGDQSRIEKYIMNIKRVLGNFDACFDGIDYSLSPWMDDSVGKLIEEAYRVVIGEIGTLYAVYDVNNKIRRITSIEILPSIGFNEVMLPVGEDNILKERVEEGLLTLSKLIALSSVCVDGLDMVAVKRDEKLLKNVILDMDSIARMKGKALGTRLIPTDEADGVHTKRFGYIPLLKP